MPKICLIGTGSTVFARNTLSRELEDQDKTSEVCRNHEYAAAMDPHSAAELSLAEIEKLVDALMAARGYLLPHFARKSA